MNTNRRQASIALNRGGDEIIKVEFPFNENDLSKIRTIPGRIYLKNSRCWTLPMTKESIGLLLKWGFNLCPSLRQYYNAEVERIANPIEVKEIKGLRKELFGYQKTGVVFIENKDGKALVADEMGLGKTPQSLAWLQFHPEKRPVIIVCPASLKLNWAREAVTWMSAPHVAILSGTTNIKLVPAELFIINYDIVGAWLSLLKQLKPKVVILDECHYVKNSSTKRSKAVKSLCLTVPHIIALTGTPIENKPVEIFNTLSIINKNLFPSAWEFKKRYCDAKHNGFGWTFDGATNVEELHEKLVSSIMIRRKKTDVLKDLPDKLFSFVPLEIDNRSEYKSVENDFIQFVRNEVERKANKKLQEITRDIGMLMQINEDKLLMMQDEQAIKAEAGGILYQMELLKQTAVMGKMEQIVNWIRDFLESGEKLVVFATHKFVIDMIMIEFGKIAVKIDGSVSLSKRDEAVIEFQTNPKIKLFVGNIKAAGVGLTLTASSNVAIVEYPWTPGELNQAIDRCHRIGQKDTVNVYYLMAVNTIEEQIAAMLDKKRVVLDAVLDGVQTEQESLLSELIATYKK